MFSIQSLSSGLKKFFVVLISYLAISFFQSCLNESVFASESIAQKPGLLPGAVLAPFFSGGTYDKSIPEPEHFLGFPVGSRPVRYPELFSYFKALDQSSEMAQLREYGKTYEGRTLWYLVISSAENMQKLEQIQKDVSLLADPRRISKETVASSIIENSPAVAWMSYSIHGDELSSTDAALQLAYQLVAGTDTLTQKLREKLVIIIDPLQNPDGRERFLAQIQSFSGKIPNPDIQSLQHTAFWPWGRGNHYLFDLNRDWFFLVHPETKGKVKAILEWNPQLLVDCHEMGAFDTYLFSPPREPFNPYMTSYIKKWWKTFASDQALAFDKYGWSYYTREWNEEWYPGYGSSWSIYIGAVGILYEQAGVEGSLVKRTDGTILSYRETVHHQFVSSISNLTTAANNRKELLKDFYQEKKKALASSGSYIFTPGKNPARADRLVQTLLAQNIEVFKAKQDFQATDLKDIWGNSLSKKAFPGGSYLVPLAQPLNHLVQVIFDFDTRLPKSFLEEERKELEKNKSTKLYEVTAWSIPMGYNLETYKSQKNVTAKLEKVTQINQPAGEMNNSKPLYGYVFELKTDNSILALTKLLQEGFKVRAAQKKFKIENKEFSPGSLLLRIKENPEKISNFLSQLAKETGISIYGVNTGLSQDGPDLGGNEFRLLQEPKVALISGSPVDFTSYGSLWHLLDQNLSLRCSTLDLIRFGWTDLEPYNVIIFPNIWAGSEALSRILGKPGIAKLKKWIEDGGTLIAINSAAAFAADTSTGLSQVRLRPQVLDKLSEYEEAVKREEAAYKPIVDTTLVWGIKPAKEEKPKEVKKPEEKKKEVPEELVKLDERQKTFMPRGAILRANLDPEHWLCFGMEEKVPVILYTSESFMSKDPVETPARLAGADNLRLSGLLWPEARERWAKTAYLTREGLGKGQIILFADEPNFRAYFYGTQRLFLNALLLGPGMGASIPLPW